MRRSIYALTLTLSAALVACEDGPNQTYQPSPVGAASNWNNGGTDAAIDPATQGFVVDAGGTTKQEICNGSQKAAKWANLVKQPIIPPTKGAGIDMSGGPTWKGLTIEDAEQINCQSDSLGGDGNVAYNSWGDSQEVVVSYLLSTHRIYYLGYNNGYTGTIDFHSRDGQHTYSIRVNSRIVLDGQQMTLDWSGVPSNPNATLVGQVEALVDSLFATFTPGLPADPHCVTSGHCKIATFSNGSGYVFVPAIGWAFRVQSVTAPQPTPSIVYYMDEYLEKVLPFSSAAPLVKLDDDGPVAISNGLGPNKKNCTLRLTSDQGKLTYADFLSNCVQVTGTSADQDELNKLLGGMTHGTERFFFDVSGVDLNFTDKSLTPDKVVADTDRPEPIDEATEWSIDQSTLGPLANDYKGNDPTAPVAPNDPTLGKDLHGSGLVYLEYARLVQEYLQKFRPAGAPLRTLGDPSCLEPKLAYLKDGSIDPNVPIPAGCTGFEGVVTMAGKAATAGSADPNVQKVAFDRATLMNDLTTSKGKLTDVSTVLAATSLGGKPGSPLIPFCGILNDGNNDPADCVSKTLWDGSFQRVIEVFGNGKISNLPVEVQDRRFFWKMYATAVFKYLHVAGNAASTADDVHNVLLQANDLFFDSSGTGQYETAEYIDRRFVTGGPTGQQDPTDVTITADILNGIFNDYNFSRYMYRGESLLYQGVRCTSTDPKACAPGDLQTPYLGQEENRALLTNLFGSPILASAYTDVMGTDGTTVLQPAYTCATQLNADCIKKGMMPPVVHSDISCVDDTTCPPDTPKCGDGKCVAIITDESGQPLLAGYPGAMTGKATIFTLGPSTMSVVNTFDSIESVMVEMRFHQDPYDTTSPYAGQPVDRLLPWLKKQAGVGFPVPLDGVHDKFINTYQADFSGTTITAVVDYDYETTNPNKIDFKAVETSDFLGDVFLCQDPATKDILPARMYSSVATILDWFAKHPGAYDACGMITRYSPYDNYADFITSLQNGVRLSVTQGGGYGRIVDVVLFTPGQ